MTDKQLMFAALEHIKSKSGFTGIREALPNENNETQLRIKLKLEDAGLVTSHIYDAWNLMPTSFGFRVVELDLKNDGTLKKRRLDPNKKAIRNTLLTTCLGAILGATISLVPKLIQSTSPSAPIVLPSIQIVHDTTKLMEHDTIYLPDSLLKK